MINEASSIITKIKVSLVPSLKYNSRLFDFSILLNFEQLLKNRVFHLHDFSADIFITVNSSFTWFGNSFFISNYFRDSTS